MNIQGKSAIVTGASGGIGHEICIKFLQNNLKNLAVVDIAKNQTTFDKLQKDFPNAKIIFEKVDICKKAEIENAYKKIKTEFGQIHILVNGAGIFNDGDVEKTYYVNAIGLIHSSLTALNYMKKENGGEGGYIINIASVAGLHPVFQMAVYCSSKYAVMGFTLSMGNDYYYNMTGVKFMAICPGPTGTPLMQNCEEKVLYVDNRPDYTDRLENIPKQTTDIVGDCVVKSIITDKNGSVWISRYGKNVEIEVPSLRESIDAIKQ